MARTIDYANATPNDGYGGYPSSYENEVFPTDGLGSLGATPDGYVGFATVTTNDPAPGGDLKIHAAPNASSPQVGGADKDGGVAVRGDMPAAPGWAYVGFGGSARNHAVNGYASLAYLTPDATPAAPVSPVSPVGPIGPAPSQPGAPAEESSSALFYGALAVGALVVGGAAYLLLKKKKRAA